MNTSRISFSFASEYRPQVPPDDLKVLYFYIKKRSAYYLNKTRLSCMSVCTYIYICVYIYVYIYIYTSGDPCISMHVGPVPGPGPPPGPPWPRPGPPPPRRCRNFQAGPAGRVGQVPWVISSGTLIIDISVSILAQVV